jgi:hypothetical protein
VVVLVEQVRVLQREGRGQFGCAQHAHNVCQMF